MQRTLYGNSGLISTPLQARAKKDTQGFHQLRRQQWMPNKLSKPKKPEVALARKIRSKKKDMKEKRQNELHNNKRKIWQASKGI